MRDIILERFPVNYDRYIEVFGGAAWILFAKKPEAFEVYNDYNSYLTNMFYVVKYRPLSFLQELGWLPLNGKEEFRILLDWKKKKDFTVPYEGEELQLAQQYLSEPQLEEYMNITKEQAELGDVAKAVLFYKLIRYSYAGGNTSYNGQPVNILQAYRSIWLANRRLNDNGIKGLANYTQIEGTSGKGVVIQNRGYASLIELYDRPTAFFYCDPPYYGTERLYTERFAIDDHYKLHEVLSRIQGKFMLSYNDCPFIRELYKDFYIEGFERLNSISQRYNPGDTFAELIISNYDPNERSNSQPNQISFLS